jgi:hypothetical protein
VGKLTKESQGYHDRLQRACSWLARAQAISGSSDAQHDLEGQFIFYWVALNALYARTKVERQADGQESKWLVDLLCEIDQRGKLRSVVVSVKESADRLLRDKYLSKLYWVEGSTPRLREVLSKEERDAKEAWEAGRTQKYFEILFRRLHVLRNQIFHGCSTDRRSLNRGSLRPAVTILKVLVPAFVKVMEEFGEAIRWPRIEYPRDGSPQNPDYLRRNPWARN